MALCVLLQVLVHFLLAHRHAPYVIDRVIVVLRQLVLAPHRHLAVSSSELQVYLRLRAPCLAFVALIRLFG